MRALFRVSRLGTIAGCMVTSGVIRRGAQVRIVRDGAVVYETTIARSSASRRTCARSAEGFECGIHLEGFNDVKEGDVLEVVRGAPGRADGRSTTPRPQPPRPADR